jgi:sterol desaturase/sphingolipid hydroxylase (fatty acid hydroxylase superfamily)
MIGEARRGWRQWFSAPLSGGSVQQLMTIVVAILAFNGLVVAFFAWAYTAPRFADNRINTSMVMRESWSKRLRIMTQTSVVSLLMVFGCAYVGFPYLIATAPASLGTSLLEAVEILLVYDFAYYLLHRAMHNKKAMRYVHGVHHRARNPSALESFYLHPVECILGIVWLFAAVWAVGPVSLAAFGIAFGVYSTLNIVVHSGLDFRKPWLAPVDFLAKKHHIHHMHDFDRNFSSLTPLPDLLFGTAK